MPRYHYLLLFLGLWALSAGSIRFRIHITSLENTQLQTLEALVKSGGWSLDATAGDGDVSKMGNRFLPNKPPGMSLILFPFAWGLERTGVRDPALVYQSLLLVTAGAVAAAGTLAFILLLRIGLAPLASFLSTLGLVFATDLWLYAGILLRHGIVAALLAMALLSPLTRTGRTGFYPFLAGLSVGALPLMDYAAIPLALVLGPSLLVLHARSQGTRAAVFFLGGCALPLFTLFSYNDAEYGSPWLSGYSPSIYQGPPEIRWESLNAVFLERPLRGFLPSLFGPSRGWLLGSPALGLALAGVLGWGPKSRTALEKISIAAGSAYFLFIVSFRYWHGGNFPGHRYLVPLPILLLPTWARILPAALRDNRVRVFLGFSLLLAAAYRVFLAWTWGASAEALAWNPASGSLGIPFIDGIRIAADNLKSSSDPLLGAGVFRDLKFIFLVWGALLTAFVGLKTRDLRPDHLRVLRSPRGDAAKV